MDAEIFQVCLDEAKDSYKAEIIWELSSNTVAEMENNLTQIQQWIHAWVAPAELPPVPPKGARVGDDDMDDE